MEGGRGGVARGRGGRERGKGKGERDGLEEARAGDLLHEAEGIDAAVCW